MIGLVEDSLPGRMKFVTKRGSFETPSHSTRYETCHDTPFIEIDSKAKVKLAYQFFALSKIPFGLASSTKLAPKMFFKYEKRGFRSK